MSQPEEIQTTLTENKSVRKWSKDFNLVWVDMEMTGLDPEKERIIDPAYCIQNGD